MRQRLGKNSALRFEIVKGTSVIGGGSAPLAHPATSLLALNHSKLSADKLEQSLRFSKPPVVARIVDDKVLLDLRTVSDAEETELLLVLEKIDAPANTNF
jgi:L-seryl-tRNA(Ser) seleniumtransferase